MTAAPSLMERLRVHINKDTGETINYLRGQGMTTVAVIRESVSLYAFAVRNRKGGRKLVSMNPDGSDVVEIM